MVKFSWTSAKASGAKRYYTGILCPAGHDSERFTSTRGCCVCVAGKSVEWKAANPDRALVQKRVWRNANIDKARALNLANQKLHREAANKRNRKYAAANREILRIKNKAWNQMNPAKVAAKASKYRAKKLQATPPWSDLALIEDIYELAAIYRDFGHDVDVDHIIPLQGRSVCGLHIPHNLQVITSVLNKSKSNGFAIL